MKKIIPFLISFLLCVSIGVTSALAQVSEFEPFPVLTQHDGEEYIGILLSESEFTKIIELKINYKFLKQTSEILEEELKVKNKNLEDTINLFNNMTSKIKTEIKNESWLDKNKGMLGVITGVVIGAGLTILTARAVK